MQPYYDAPGGASEDVMNKHKGSQVPYSEYELKYSTEAEIQHEIVMMLQDYGALVHQFAIPGTHKRLGGIIPAGYPDLEVLFDGKVYWFEIKSYKGRSNANQIEMHKKFLAQGFTVHIVRSKEEVKQIIGE